MLRVTAFPTCLPTTNATRVGSPDERALKRPWARTVRDPARRPRLMVVRMSSLVRRRWAALSTARPARLRPTGVRGPCDDDRRGSRGRRGYAYAGGSRACGPGGGCSAGRCASSRECSPSCLGPQRIAVIGYWAVSGSTATARLRTRAKANPYVGMRQVSRTLDLSTVRGRSSGGQTGLTPVTPHTSRAHAARPTLRASRGPVDNRLPLTICTVSVPGIPRYPQAEPVAREVARSLISRGSRHGEQ